MIENFGGDAETTELLRRMKARAARTPVIEETSDEEYDAPPDDWWDEQPR